MMSAPGFNLLVFIKKFPAEPFANLFGVPVRTLSVSLVTHSVRIPLSLNSVELSVPSARVYFNT